MQDRTITSSLLFAVQKRGKNLKRMFKKPYPTCRAWRFVGRTVWTMPSDDREEQVWRHCSQWCGSLEWNYWPVMEGCNWGLRWRVGCSARAGLCVCRASGCVGGTRWRQQMFAEETEIHAISFVLAPLTHSSSLSLPFSPSHTGNYTFYFFTPIPSVVFREN